MGAGRGWSATVTNELEPVHGDGVRNVHFQTRDASVLVA